jgi:hypothetical protein
VESYSGISVTLKPILNGMQKGPELLFTNNVFFFHLRTNVFFLEAPKTKNLKPFWGFEKDLGIIGKKAVL